jgi:hypothetical protein
MALGPKIGAKNLAAVMARGIELVSRVMASRAGKRMRPRTMGRFSSGASKYPQADFCGGNLSEADWASKSHSQYRSAGISAIQSRPRKFRDHRRVRWDRVVKAHGLEGLIRHRHRQMAPFGRRRCHDDVSAGS